MDLSLLPVILATMAVIGGSLLALRRFPNRRLRLMTLTVGWMALAQFAYIQRPEEDLISGDRDLSRAHYFLVGGLSMLALYFLGTEALDRKLSKHKPQPVSALAGTVRWTREAVTDSRLDIKTWLVSPEMLVKYRPSNWNIDIAESEPQRCAAPVKFRRFAEREAVAVR